MIFVECKPDFLLIRKIGFSKKEIKHCGNKPGVCKMLMKNKDSIGLVDEDPGSSSPSYIYNLENMKDSLIIDKFGVKVLYDKKRNNHIIILKPYLEAWICQIAKDCGIDLKKYNLPNEPYILHQVINYNLNKFEKMIDDLMNKKNRKGLDLLINVLTNKI